MMPVRLTPSPSWAPGVSDPFRTLDGVAFMTLESFRLAVTHQRLDDAIRDESKRSWPDVARIQRLKKLKLAIKDRLNSLAMRGRTLRMA